MVRYIPRSRRASHCPEFFYAAGHRLADLSKMLSNGELPIVHDTQKIRDGIAEHSSTVNGVVLLPGRFCPVDAAEGRPVL